MDIRVINSRGEVINATTLHLKTDNHYLIGLTADNSQQILIEACRSSEEAIGYLDAIKEVLKVGQEEGLGNVLIDLEGKEYKCCGKCKND